MRRIAIHVLALQVALASFAPAGLVELVRLPGLLKHYAEHRTESHGLMTFGEFMELHFADARHAEDDNERHANLPFHNHAPVVHDMVPSHMASVQAPASAEVPAWSALRNSTDVGQWPGRSVFHPPKSRA